VMHNYRFLFYPTIPLVVHLKSMDFRPNIVFLNQAM
jgi:hypothetical protein